MKNLAKLYKIMLKKLLVPALIIGILSIVSSALYLGGEIKSMADYGYGNFFRGQPTAAVIAPSLIIVMFLGSAVLTFTAFNYLNKRNASDFYHALPYTRMDMFWSGILAVFTYQLSTIVLTLAASYAVLAVSAISFNASFFPLLLLGYSACSLLVIGAVALAMSVTGTIFANVMVSGLILLLPRLLLFVIDRFIISVTMSRVLIGRMGIFLNPVYNIATASLLDISRIWQYYGLSETLINPGSIIYTAVLGLIYLTLAVMLMKKRPSELAGNGAPNKKVASLYSALISLPLLIFGVYSINGQPLSSISYRTMMALIIIIAVAFVIYIVIGYAMTTKWKTVFKSLPWFAVAFAAAVAMVFGASLVAKDMGTKLPDREQIAYISIDENSETEYRYRPTYAYNALLASQIKFDDEKVMDLFYDTLKQNNEQWERQSNGDYESAYATSSQILCEFKLKSGKSLYRKLSLYMKDMDEIYEVLTGNDQYMQAHTSLPENGTVSTYDEEITDAEIAAVWDTFRKEYAGMTPTEKLYLNTTYSYNPIYSRKMQGAMYPQYISNFTVQGYLGDTPYIKPVEISSYTPMTANYYMQMMNDKNLHRLLPDLEKLFSMPDDVQRIYVNIQVPVDGIDSVYFMYASDMDVEEMQYMPEALTLDELSDVVGVIKRQSMGRVSIDTPYASISVGIYGIYEGDNEYYNCFVPLTEEDVTALFDQYQAKITAIG